MELLYLRASAIEYVVGVRSWSPGTRDLVIQAFEARLLQAFTHVPNFTDALRERCAVYTRRVLEGREVPIQRVGSEFARWCGGEYLDYRTSLVGNVIYATTAEAVGKLLNELGHEQA